MKTKIFKLVTILFVLIVGSSSCEEEKPEERPFLTVDEMPITAMAAAGTYAIAVSSNGEWTALVEDAANNEWCTLVNASGTNDGTVTVNVAENTDITFASRSATIKITLGGLTKSVTINQVAIEPFLTVDETPITAIAAAGTYAIAVRSNGEWTALVKDAANNEWCTLIGASGSNNGIVTVNIAENTTTASRSTIVKITLGYLTKSVRINQYSTEDCWWDYPIKPGMPEWAELHTHADKVAACQIPENILPLLSTKCLAEACLQYPLLYSIFAFSCYDDGFDRFFEDFNGIRAFYEREGALTELLKHYNSKIQDMSILDSSASNIEKGRFVASIAALDVLLYGFSQKVDASIETYKDLLRNLILGYEKMLEYPVYFYYNSIGLIDNFSIRAHIILKISPESPIPPEALCAAGLSQEHMNIINQLSYQLIQ